VPQFPNGKMQIRAKHHLCVITPLLFSSVSLKLEAVVFQQALALEVIYFFIYLKVRLHIPTGLGF
jgi:hypothetical protein